MRSILRTDSSNADFQTLVKQLDADLAIRDGDEHAFYDQFNKIDRLKHVVVIYDNEKAVACGAFKEFAAGIIEIKRMFVLPSERNKGYASAVLKELEKWAAEMGYEKCILETGVKQFEAIGLYHRNNFSRIPNFPPYEKMKNSLCFQKLLS